MVFFCLLFFFVFLFICFFYFFSFSFSSNFYIKCSPFECGFIPFVGGFVSFSLPFFMVSLMFLLFDVEILLVCFFPLFTFINSFSGFIWLIVFLIMLATLYEWALGLFDWS